MISIKPEFYGSTTQFMIIAICSDIVADGLIFFLLRQGRYLGAALLIILPWASLQTLSSILGAFDRDTMPMQWIVLHSLRSALMAGIATFVTLGVYLLIKERHKGRQLEKQLMCTLAIAVLVAACDIPVYDANRRLDESLLNRPTSR